MCNFTVKKIRYYLKNYEMLKLTLKNMKEQRQDLILALNEKSYPVAIAKYENTSGGYSELNSLEKILQQKEKDLQRIKNLDKKISIMEKTFYKIDEAMKILSREEQLLLRGFFIQKKSWQILATELYISEKWAKNKTYTALRVLTSIISGKLSTDPMDNLTFSR